MERHTDNRRQPLWLLMQSAIILVTMWLLPSDDHLVNFAFGLAFAYLATLLLTLKRRCLPRRFLD